MDKERIIENLQKGASSLSCGGYLQTLDALHRSSIYVSAGFDRFMRKYNYIIQLYESNNNDWNQTIMTLLFRTIGVGPNRENYDRLSRLIGFDIILAERHSQTAIEALLLGTSGLLALYRDDEYIRNLKNEYFYLCRKYTSLEQMRFGEWRIERTRPYNHPVLRLVQIAAVLSKQQFLLNDILACTSTEDVERIFNIEASSYWNDHFLHGEKSAPAPKRIGHEKCNIIAINLVAPLQYTYGYYIETDSLRSRAISLLESIPPENNTYIRQWAKYGIVPHDAFEGQALLQIATEYCANRRCKDCPVCESILNKAERQEAASRIK